MAVPSTRELIQTTGRHVGGQRACGCCGTYQLFAVKWPDGTLLLLCARCDVEK